MNVRHRSMHSLVCTSGAMAAVLLGGAVSTASAAASLTPLGDLPGGSFSSQAYGVSGDGSVVVGSSYSGSGFEAFRWTSDGGMVGLGYLPGGAFSSEARGVSADGSVIVGGSRSASGFEAFRWTAAGGMQGLGDLPGGAFSSQARGVSGDGSVIVGYGSPASGLGEAFRWTSGGGMVGLGDLPGGPFLSGADGVSADASVVVGHGFYGNSAIDTEAFRWTSGGGMVGLGDLPGGAFYSVARGVSADGSVIVGFGRSVTGDEAFRWTSGGGMVGLGTLPGGVGSNALGVNGDGSIIVGFSQSSALEPGFEAFVWDAENGMRNLKNVLMSDHGLDLTGWTLQYATGISTDGRTIVGNGLNPSGEPEVWIARIEPIPEPAAGALALLGVSSILLLRRRSLGRPNEFLCAPSGFRARRQIMRSNVCAFLAILLYTSAAARAFAAASLTPLGDLPGGEFFSEAFDVSADGATVVGFGTSANGVEAFRWTAGGGMVGLGDLPGGIFLSRAFGVSADGATVVGEGVPANGGEAFRWTAGGGMVGLGDLPDGFFVSGALDVSADGATVVGIGSSANGFEAFRWTAGGGMVGLGDLPGGTYSSSANGVSADGATVVGGGSSANGIEAFRWTAGGGMVGLGDLPGGQFLSAAWGVSADGATVVGSGSSANGEEAFRWTAGGGMAGLGDLPGGAFSSQAFGVSADGATVVGTGISDIGAEAFLWTPQDGMRRLQDVLTVDLGLDLTGWTLCDARAVTPDGLTIVGTGTHNGNTEAFVAVIPTIVPEPAAGALALLGVSSILMLRRRCVWRPNKFLWAPGGFRARKQIMRSNVCAFLAILLCTSAAARAFAAASLTPLGDLPGGGFFSWADDVSGDGSVVVGMSSSSASAPFREAFRWTQAGGMQGLGDFSGARFQSGAHAVNYDGSVVVGWGTIASDLGQAFRWTSAGGMQGLGVLPGSTSSYANGVSDDGSVVVGHGVRESTTPSTADFEAFRWTSGGGMVGLGDLPGGSFSSGASGVSADGSVIVGYGHSDSGRQAFRWTSGGGMVGLGDLPGGEFESWAFGVSDDGSVVVGWGNTASSEEAFRWTSDGGMRALGIPPGAVGSQARAVNGDGSVIVGLGFSAGSQEAFRWTADGGMRKLWDVLLSHGVDPAADGWTELTSASGISADGSTIVGHGRRNDNIEAFVAVIPVVPEPATGALALLGASSILLLRRRSLWRPNKVSLSKVAAMLASYRRPRERSNPMRQLKLFRWAAALTLAIALAPGAASAQEDDTLTISGKFSPIWLDGTVGPDLAEVYANGHDHTWTLTLHGTTKSHSTYSTWFGYIRRATKIHATSFDLEFFGPDAATLNGIVSDHIAGGDISVYLENAYSSGFGDDFAVWDVSVFGPDVEFWTGELSDGWNTLFPSDADGYPVVGPAPFSIWAEDNILVDNRPGNDGWMGSGDSLVTFEGSVGGPEPVVLAVADASGLEGDRGFSNAAVAVTLSNASSQAITVSYRTVDGTAKAKADYTATSGTLTFQPGETSRTISVSIKADRKREPDETFSVQLSNAVGATVGVATVTILNDD